MMFMDKNRGKKGCGGIKRDPTLSLYEGDPTNATLYTLESYLKYVSVVARAERLAPRIGFIGNLFSLGINIIPNTKYD